MGVSDEQATRLRALYAAAMADPAKRAAIEAGRLRPSLPLTDADLAELRRRIADLTVPR